MSRQKLPSPARLESYPKIRFAAHHNRRPRQPIRSVYVHSRRRQVFGGLADCLAIVRRRLPDDWAERYNTTPVLIETFVETPRHTGAVYNASGWIRVGTTQGRGRYDRNRQSDKPKKDVWLRPLRRDWKRTLNR